MKKHEIIPGIRVKYRTEERDGRRIATATIWVDNKPLREIATFDLALSKDPGDPAYQGWVEAIGNAFRLMLSRATGLDGIMTKRRKADYKGERDGHDHG
jgi:hypothetical protein